MSDRTDQEVDRSSGTDHVVSISRVEHKDRRQTLTHPLVVAVIAAVVGAVVGSVATASLAPSAELSSSEAEFDNPDGSINDYDPNVGANLTGSINGPLVNGQTVWVANRPHQKGDLSEADLNGLYFAPGPCGMEDAGRWSCNQVFLGNEIQAGDYDVFVFLASPNAARMLVQVAAGDGPFVQGLGLELEDAMMVTRN